MTSTSAPPGARRLALAASSNAAAQAGEEIARAGGNAVDATIAAALVSMSTEPGVIGLGAGAYVAVGPSGGEPLVIDGYVEMPGRGLDLPQGSGCRSVLVDYGGGVRTQVGPGTVGTPGAFAAMEIASRRFGRLPWSDLFEPAIRWARSGFPLPPASHRYLLASHLAVFGEDPDTYAALHDGDRLRAAGETIQIPHLADTLAQLAREGAAALHGGTLGSRVARAVRSGDGLLTEEDLRAYRAIPREPRVTDLGDWQLATNPEPAIGGTVLAAMLQLIDAEPDGRWSIDEIHDLIRVQEAVLGFRRERLERADDFQREADVLLGVRDVAELRRLLGSPSTIQASGVDGEGLSCSISASTGYSAGVSAPGTGFWLNNCLGEIELNPHGLHADPPGTRLRSNMAPTVGRRRDGSVLAIASPGADRITTALLQVLVGYVKEGMPLAEAVDHPRLHVEFPDGEPMVAFEAGLPVERLPVRSRRFDGLSMYFGGVGVAVAHASGALEAASDPRREGGVALV